MNHNNGISYNFEPIFTFTRFQPKRKLVNSEAINIFNKGLGFDISPKNILVESIIYNIQKIWLDEKECIIWECSLIIKKVKPPKINLKKGLLQTSATMKILWS